MKSMLPMFGNYQMLVSPTNARLCIKAVTDFILDYHSNFQLFFDSLDFFVTFFIKEKSKWKPNKMYPHQLHIKNLLTYNSDSADLRKKAIKKIWMAGVKKWNRCYPSLANDFMSVSSTNDRLCKYVVTDFILDYHSNFQLFFGSLDFFVTFFIKEKSK